MIGEKIYDKFTKTDKPQVIQSIKEDKPQITQSHKEDKGEQLMRELQKDKKPKSKPQPTKKEDEINVFDDFEELFL